MEAIHYSCKDSESTETDPPAPPTCEYTYHGGAITVSSDWSTPENVGCPVNTNGWEDSISISPDGQTLYFGYSNYDFLTFIISGGTERNQTGPDRGLNSTDLADIMISYKTGEYWEEPFLPENINEIYALNDGAFSQDGIVLYSSGLKSENIGSTSTSDIYVSVKPGDVWSVPSNVGPPVNTSASESNPWISSDETLILYDSDRTGGQGDRDVWKAEKVGGIWQEPVNFGTPVNTSHEETQPFLTQDGNTLYFTRAVDSVPGIYQSNYQAGTGWSEPELIISSSIAVGEPTLTSDGNELYFVHLFQMPDGSYNADVMVTRKNKRNH